jgi:hypothetical protein
MAWLGKGMTPGPNLIRRIPASGDLVKFATANSGNTCGARRWTDGKVETPMMPHMPWLRVNPVTGELFWGDETEEVNTEEPREAKPEYLRVPFAVEPGLHGYRRALESGLGSEPDKTLYLHLGFWWAANDPFRRGRPDAVRPPDFAEKLHALIALLDPRDPGDRLMIAEARRQLGEFAAAGELLAEAFPKPLWFPARIVRKWTERQDDQVRELRD